MICSRLPPDEDPFEAAVRKADERRAQERLNRGRSTGKWTDCDPTPELEREAILEFESKPTLHTSLSIIQFFL